MRAILISLFYGLLMVLGRAETVSFNPSMKDRYTLEDTEKWTVTVDSRCDLRFAFLKIKPKAEKTFDLMLYFYCDTKDLSRFDTPKKMKKALVGTSAVYLGHTVEKEIIFEPLTNKGWYGFKTRITDPSLVNVKPIPTGQFLYIIRGMIRLSKDSALGFSLMTNDTESSETAEILKYIYGFAKEKGS